MMENILFLKGNLLVSHSCCFIFKLRVKRAQERFLFSELEKTLIISKYGVIVKYGFLFHCSVFFFFWKYSMSLWLRI